MRSKFFYKGQEIEPSDIEIEPAGVDERREFNLESVHKALEKANQEAARRRRELREVETKLAAYDDINVDDVRSVQAELERLRSQNTELTADRDKNILLEAFTNSEIAKTLIFKPEHALKVFGDHFEIRDGSVIAKAGPDGQQLGFEDKLTELIGDDESIIRSTGMRGGGSSPGRGFRLSSTPTALDRAAKSGDLDEYKRLRQKDGAV